MENVIVFYHWQFSVQVENRNGRKYKNHFMHTQASCFETAKALIKDSLKKKGWKFLQFNKVSSVRVANAVYTQSKSGKVPEDLYCELPMPEIPKDLNRKRDTAKIATHGN